MSSSGTVVYRATANTVINAALRVCGALDPENTAGPSTAQTAMGLEALNMILKSWGARGLQLWERKYGVVFPQPDQGVYVLGGPGPAGDHACLSTPLNSGFVQTTLDGDASGTTIVVASVTGQLNTVGSPGTTITSGYYIGVQLDDGSLQWTTVNGAPSGTTVTLTATLTDTASDGNVVYCYATKLIRPLRVSDAWIRQTQQGNDTPVMVISREQYNRFGMKSSSGQQVQMYYDTQVNTGIITLYPVPSLATQLLFIEFQRPIDDLTASTEDFDIPQEWFVALKFILAQHLAPECEVSQFKYTQIKDLAKEAYSFVNDWDQEPASFSIQPASQDYNMDGRN